ncbi:hypothetical protein ACJMK2_018977 [Sinanodonta woodiana]|uniref:Uncharacterized protein n=1 Tax=Sinanodonta woodiana TaxID=1069815 RepID=A0ABD3UI23_SINWO
MKMMMASVQWPVWLMLMVLCWEHCVGQKGAADQAGDHTVLYSHLVLLDSLPTGINALSPLDLVIRTNYSGRVEFQEADSFKILLNISSPTIEETYTVVSALSEDKGRLLLQVYNDPMPVPNISLDWICIVIVGLTGIVLIGTSIFAVWWYTTKQYFEMFSGSRNQLLYRAAQAGDLPTAQGDMVMLGEDDLGGDVTTTDYHVAMPELPEEEEEEEEGADMIRMEMLRTHGSAIRTENYPDNSDDEDDDTTFIKSRMTSTVNKSHQVWTETQRDKGVERTQGHDRIEGVLKYFTDQSDDEGTEVYNNSVGGLKYPADQSEDELEANALQSPDQKIADADGDYTPLDDLDDLVDMSGVHENKSARKQQDEADSGEVQPSHSDHALKREGSKKRHISTPDTNSCRSNREPSYVNLQGGQMGLPVLRPVDDTIDIYSYLRVDGSSIQSQPPFLADERMGSFPSKNDTQGFSSTSPLEGQYIRLKPVPAKVKLKPKNVPCPTVDSYSNDTLMTFKSSNSALSKQATTAKPIPVPKKSESKGHLGFGDASPVGHTVHPLLLSEPRSPGTFSLLSDGSNDIFETRDFDVDDLENPQDADMMSNASLPLPSPPVHSQFDPYETPMISQLSPRQSYISGSPGDFWTGTCIALTGSPSPGISFKSKDEARDSGIVSSNQAIAQQEESRFVFPPAPPSPAHIIYSSQTRRQLYLDEQRRDDLCPSSPGGTNSSTANRAETIAENVSSEGDRFQREGGASRKRGRGGKGKMSMLHISVLCSLCLFGVMTGVFSRTAQGTTVDIIVFSPAKFLSKNVSIYMAKNKFVEVEPGSHLYKQFESDNPILWRRNSTLCETSQCAQGCDDNTGHCICRKGYIMSKDGRCEDINECTEGVGTCDISAGCFNKMGSYECLCAGDYYGDGKSCKECLSPCPVGKFEVQPCDTKHNKQKICKDCTISCTDGYYMSKLCEKDKDADCRMCQSRCSDNEFEYRQCSTDQNRECRVKVSLAAPKMSENIMFEDIQRVVQDAKSEISFSPNSDKFKHFRFVLDRGTDDSGAYIDVTVSYMDLAAKFKSVNQSINTDMNQPDRQQGTNEVRQKFCSSPLPQHFQLTYQIHKEVLFQRENGRLEACGKDNGFPNRLADSMLCSEPSPLSNVFHMNESTFNPTVSAWIQKSETCTRKHEECETCYRLLGFSMKNSQDCVIRREEHQSEVSPRLQLCYSCAAKNNCSAVCKDYHGKDCRMIRCERGNLVQYSLTPVYPAGQKFLCYVKPVMGQRLIQVNYSVKKHSAILLKGSITVETDEEWKETGKIERRDNIFRVSIDSMLNNMPNLVQGVNHSKHQAGIYQPQGTKLEQTKVDTHAIPVQPSSPFGFSASVFGTTGCGNEDISSLIVARDDPILVLSDLTVQHVDLDASYYITNNSQLPKVVISVDRSTSILKAVYPTGELKHNSLNAHLSLQANHWLLNVTGELLFIPGVININVSDPFYKNSTLYQYELAVNGTPMFSINFSIPTGDLPTVSKSFLIRAQDRVSTHHLIAHRPAPDIKAIRAIEQSHEESSINNRERSMSMPNPPHFSILFIASVSGAICLLLFILMVGVVLEQGIPDGNIQRFQVRHLVLLVIYIVFQFLYALVVSMTVFLFVVIAINGETASFLQHYNQHRSVKTDVTQLELDYMQHHLEAEVARLNNITDSRRKTCEEKIQLIRNDFTNLKDVIMRRSQENLKQQDLKNLINEHMRRVTEKFSENLSVFRQKFEAERQFMIRKLVSDIQNTYKTIEHNKWLAGVTYLYNDVVNTHRLFNSSSVIRPFMDWADLDMDISDLTADISLPLPRMPSLDPHLHGEHPDIQQTSPSSPQSIPLRTEKKNLWYLYSQMNNMSQNMSQGQASNNTSQRTTKFSTGIYTMFFACMVCIDFFWFLHRMIKSVAVGRLLLYGYPVYVDARDRKDDALPSADNGQRNIKGKCYSSPRNKFCKFARVVASKAMSSLFIPKMIGTIFVCLLVYMISITSMKFINRQTFSYLGYYNNMDDLLKINELFINVRLQAHADHINQLEFPIYSSMMTAHVQRNLYLHNLLKTQWRDIEDFHTYTYCHYMKQMTVNARCGDTYDENGLLEVSVEECTFEPIQIQRYKRAITSSTRTREAQMDSFLRNIQQLISNTCHVILVYLAVIILKDLLGTVLWIYIKRSGVISLRIIYETDNAPDSYTAAESTTNRAAQ